MLNHKKNLIFFKELCIKLSRLQPYQLSPKATKNTPLYCSQSLICDVQNEIHTTAASIYLMEKSAIFLTRSFLTSSTVLRKIIGLYNNILPARNEVNTLIKTVFTSQAK